MWSNFDKKGDKKLAIFNSQNGSIKVFGKYGEKEDPFSVLGIEDNNKKEDKNQNQKSSGSKNHKKVLKNFSFLNLEVYLDAKNTWKQDIILILAEDERGRSHIISAVPNKKESYTKNDNRCSHFFDNMTSKVTPILHKG